MKEKNTIEIPHPMNYEDFSEYMNDVLEKAQDEAAERWDEYVNNQK